MTFSEALLLYVVVILIFFAPTILYCVRSAGSCDETNFMLGWIGMFIFLYIIAQIASLFINQTGQLIFVISSWIAACLYGWYSAKKQD